MQGSQFRKNFLMNTGAPVPKAASLDDYQQSIGGSDVNKPKGYDQYKDKKKDEGMKRITLKSKK